MQNNMKVTGCWLKFGISLPNLKKQPLIEYSFETMFFRFRFWIFIFIYETRYKR